VGEKRGVCSQKGAGEGQKKLKKGVKDATGRSQKKGEFDGGGERNGKKNITRSIGDHITACLTVVREGKGKKRNCHERERFLVPPAALKGGKKQGVRREDTARR